MNDRKNEESADLFVLAERYLGALKGLGGDHERAMRLLERVGENGTKGRRIYVNGEKVVEGSGSRLVKEVIVLTTAHRPNAGPDICVAAYGLGERYDNLISVIWRPSGSQTVRRIRLVGAVVVAEHIWGGMFEEKGVKDTVTEILSKRPRAVVRAEAFPSVFMPAVYACAYKTLKCVLLDAHGREFHDLPCHELPDFPLYYAPSLHEAQELFERSTVPVALLGI